MKRLLCMMLVFSSISVFSQKEIKVISFKQSTSDISARTNQREDLTGEACALVKVQLPIRNALFDGEIIGEIAYKTNEYWVYMPQKSTQFRIKLQDCTPLNVVFNNYDIPSLESKGTYELCVIRKEASSPQLYNEGMTALAKNDIVTAFEKLEKASEAGYAPAAYELGQASLVPYDRGYEDNPNTTESYQEAYNYYKKAAEGGCPEAQYALGKMLLDYQNNYPEELSEINVDPTYLEETRIWNLIKSAADKDVVDAQYRMLSDDKWCKENANKGNAIAEFGMGLRYDPTFSIYDYPMLESIEVSATENYEEAVKWYCKAADKGLDLAQWKLGELYARGLGVNRDMNKAVLLREKAAEQGKVIFQLIMAMSYNYGEIADLAIFESYGTSENALSSWNAEIPEDAIKADYWLRKVSNHVLTTGERRTIDNNSMYSDAMYILAQQFEKKKELDKAIYWYQRTAEKEDEDEFYKPIALAKLGMLFCVKQNYAKAIDYLEQGMKDGGSKATCYLGIMYRDGLGIETNKDKAKELLMKAIEFDGTDNMPYYELGNLYYEESKYEDALKYYKEAKSNSFDREEDGKYVWLNEFSTKACYKLGIMYDAGHGVEKNAEKAIEYMTEAASRGSDEAKLYLQKRNLPMPSPKLGSNAND